MGKVKEPWIDELIRSNRINPLLMRNDEFDLFIRDRARQLLDLIEQAMGRKISGRDSEEVIKEYGGPLTAPDTDAESVA